MESKEHDLANSKLNRMNLILKTLNDVSMKKNIYFKKKNKLKKMDDVLESLLAGSGAIAVSSLLATIVTINPIALVIGAVFTSVSTVGGAMKRVYNVQGKHDSCKTTYNQLSDLERESRAILVKNHLSSQDLQILLDVINTRLSLIEDSSIGM